jgi:tol-pal system-associated acyl-CoA thioesterase
VNVEQAATSNGQPFRWPLRVYYEDTDLGGVVYYANYLKFMERARTEWLRALGIEMSVLARELHCQFVVSRADVAFRRAARLDDALVATVRLIRRTPARLVLDQRVAKGDAELVHGTVTLACITTDTFRPTPIPSSLVRILESIA